MIPVRENKVRKPTDENPSRGPALRRHDRGNLVIVTTDGDCIEAAGVEVSWRADFLSIWPADPDAVQTSIKKDDIAGIGLTNPGDNRQTSRVVEYWFGPVE